MDRWKTKTAIREDGGFKTGASEGIRTLDIHLGKVTLYQTELHSRVVVTGKKMWKGGLQCKSPFLELASGAEPANCAKTFVTGVG
jgi:hypothetical protein